MGHQLGTPKWEQPMAYSDHDRTKVLAALSDDRYTWRTIRGVATDTQVAESQVLEIFNHSRDRVIFSNYYSKQGEQLFALREHLIKKLGFVGQISGAFHNRLY
jgi:hypothetical protein